MTKRVFLVSIFLTLLLAISNTYLALKVGFLTAASIPAAILSMGILKFAKNSTLFEHNLIQTAASSGEAIAGGIAYTLPALIIIGFWSHFNYWENVLLAMTGGIIGVLFSAIIRRPLLNDQTLKFPEGQAISEVLKLKEKRVIGLKEILQGSLLGAIVELGQNTQAIFSGFSQFFIKSQSLLTFGLNFSPALMGAGYIIGMRIGISLLLGALLSYGVVLPWISHPALMSDPAQLFANQFGMPMRYVGVGAMLVAALITLLRLLKPICQNINKTLSKILATPIAEAHRDLSPRTITLGLIFAFVIIGILFTQLFALPSLGFSIGLSITTLLLSVLYVAVIGFIMTIVCGYFSGLVGVSASPGSSILIAGLLLAALLIHALFVAHNPTMSSHQLLWGEAITILISSAVMQIACISNDTLQDLKVGQIIGASPRQQQIMLIFGVVIASLVVPAVMEVLYQAYGIYNQVPRTGMDLNNTLSAPPAAIMAALTQAIFNGNVPWQDLEIGAAIMLAVWILSTLTKRKGLELSLVGVGIGMYLPLSASTPLIIGGLISCLVWAWHKSHPQFEIKQQKNLLLACGLVTGATLMDVLLAIPVALNTHGNGFSFHIHTWAYYSLGVIVLLIILRQFIKK